ncbi:MAG: sulfatase [Acidobacteriota bacterium]
MKRAFDLVDELPFAETTAEVREIDFGAPLHRKHLVAGWSRGELDRSADRTFAWGLGEASVVEFHLLEPRPLELTLEGRPYRDPDAPPQVVTVTVNGQRIGELTLPDAVSRHVLRLAPEPLLAGRNRLELAYRWSRSPREQRRSDDSRMLAVAWYTLRFEGAAASPEPVAEAGESARLFLPFGTRVEYTLKPELGSELRIARWSVRGAGRLEVEVQTDPQASVLLGELVRSGENAALELPSDRLLRLTLEAIPNGGQELRPESAAAGVLLGEAAVWSPAELISAPNPANALEASVGVSAPASGTPPRPNIVLYVIDTLRADHLGCYGYERAISPRIDAFAERAVLFERVVAQSSWTRSSMASVLTGLWPYRHATNRRSERLSDAAATLPERLQEAGYRTAAFITNPNLTAGFGFDQGFDHFEYLGEETTSAEVHQRVVDWLEQRRDASPFLLYVHTLDPHAPYDPPAQERERWAPGVSAVKAEDSMRLVDGLQAGRIELSDALRADLRALYDAEIAANDASFGALIDELATRGLFGDALVAVMSDHGEEFHEHGNWQHGRALHGESIAVPLIVKLPGMHAGRRISQPVQHADLLPTVLAYLGLEPAVAIEGRSLLPLLAEASGDGPRWQRQLFSYLHLDSVARVSVHDGDWKLIQQIESDRLVWPRLYRPSEDPGEQHNLAERYPLRVGYLATAIRRKMAADLAAAGTRLDAEQGVIDPSVEKSLRALGYLD